MSEKNSNPSSGSSERKSAGQPTPRVYHSTATAKLDLRSRSRTSSTNESLDRSPDPSLVTRPPSNSSPDVEVFTSRASASSPSHTATHKDVLIAERNTDSQLFVTANGEPENKDVVFNGGTSMDTSEVGNNVIRPDTVNVASRVEQDETRADEIEMNSSKEEKREQKQHRNNNHGDASSDLHMYDKDVDDTGHQETNKISMEEIGKPGRNQPVSPSKRQKSLHSDEHKIHAAVAQTPTQKAVSAVHVHLQHQTFQEEERETQNKKTSESSTTTHETDRLVYTHREIIKVRQDSIDHINVRKEMPRVAETTESDDEDHSRTEDKQLDCAHTDTTSRAASEVLIESDAEMLHNAEHDGIQKCQLVTAYELATQTDRHDLTRTHSIIQKASTMPTIKDMREISHQSQHFTFDAQINENTSTNRKERPDTQVSNAWWSYLLWAVPLVLIGAVGIHHFRK